MPYRRNHRGLEAKEEEGKVEEGRREKKNREQRRERKSEVREEKREDAFELINFDFKLDWS